MRGLSGVIGRRTLSAGTLMIAAGGLALYQMTSLVLGPGGGRELHFSLGVPAADADERNESWNPSSTPALGMLAGPARATSAALRSGVAHGAAIAPAGLPAVAPVRPVAPQPALTQPSAPPVAPIAGRPAPQPVAHKSDEPD